MIISFINIKNQIQNDYYLQDILKFAVGNPTSDKMQKIIKSYLLDLNKYLMNHSELPIIAQSAGYNHSVDFYEKLDFKTEIYRSEYGRRYICSLNVI